MQKIEGGYVLLRKKEISSLRAQISSRLVTLREGRGRLGVVEMRAIRGAAESARGKKKSPPVIPRYLGRELVNLSGLSIREANKTLKNQAAAVLLLSGEGRLVPVPRRILRFLASCQTRSVFLTLLIYIERGLTLDERKIKNAGTAKASFIAEQTGLSLRSVRLARANLLQLGIITPDTTKYQRKLNRDGAYYTFNLTWSGQRATRISDESKGNPRAFAAQKTAISTSQAISKTAPLTPPKCTQFAPPIRDSGPSYEVRNQKLSCVAAILPGVFTGRKEGTKFNGQGGRSKPSLRDVSKADLEDFSRCHELYEQACKAGWLRCSEASRLNWFGAAVRAKSTKGSDQVRVFLGIVKRGLWMNITNEQEERARGAIRRYSPK